jgi:signal transduction histidine kinase/HPt (histidine-containing phosphotransfer) domain-containing protein/CHASE3 domain sensor protein/ActR/RegA family two-component response regulator
VKRISVQIKIGFLMIMAVVLLSATGYLSYRNLSSIVNSIQVDLKPDLRMASIRDISMDLEKAQNSIRIYTNTHNTADLKPYYAIISNIDDKVSRLQSECMGDSLVLQQTDTISKLIEKNILNWNQLLYLYNNRTVVEDLRQLSDKLDSSSLEASKNEKNILKRVFSHTVKNKLGEKEIISNLKEIEQQDSITKERLMRREAKLAITSTEIKEQFYDLITKIENEISVLINTKATAANELADKTYIWLAMFSVSGTLLAIIVMLIIIRYVRKTHVYQIALQSSKDEAEQLAKTKELFMANMSHEIRTPVTAISGFTEQLLHEPLDESTIRSVRIIKSSSDHLAKIINDILDFSKLQNGRLSLERVHFNINQILEDIYALFERQALRNNTELSYSTGSGTPAVLLGDPYRLKQILINLVSNSVKFTRNGRVKFSVDYTLNELSGTELILVVNDTGIGIEESKIDFIFEDFTQEEMSTTRKYGGTGLGLSIVKKLVELHHGTIVCVSKKNEGTTVTCHIPYETGDESLVKKEIEQPVYVPEEIRNLKMLIVDDEEYNRLLFKTILDRWQVIHREVPDGMEALEILKTERFDLLFMDARMPGIDGLKATQFIRQEMKIMESEMPVICISAASVNEDWIKYRNSGMNAFLPKPFSEETLLTTILSVIQDNESVPDDQPIINTGTATGSSDKVDLKNLYHISGGDEQFVKQMLISFIDSTRNGLIEMQEAVNSGKFDPVAELAHKMMPPCRHLGVSDLAILLKKIEESVHNNAESQTLIQLTWEAINEFDTISVLISEQIAKIK